MNYIVMDLEWNQSAKGKQFSEDHFPFEIIQIGAAKVNEKLDIVDEWQCTTGVYKAAEYSQEDIRDNRK